jgi:hypothetical protein
LKKILIVVLLLVFNACSTKQTTSNNNSISTTNPSSAPSSTNPAAPAAQQAAKVPGDLKEGEASGSIVNGGETVALKYAYGGHAEMFDEEAVAVLVTDTPLSPEALTKAFEKYGHLPEGVRGLEYKVGKGFWVRYNPGGFQISGSNSLKDYSVENGIVKGRDEDTTDFDGKVYKRSVSFVARLPEKK